MAEIVTIYTTLRKKMKVLRHAIKRGLPKNLWVKKSNFSKKSLINHFNRLISDINIIRMKKMFFYPHVVKPVSIRVIFY